VISRRALLLGGGAVAATGLVAAGVGVQQGVLPGRPWLQEQLGLNGEAGVVPDVVPGPVEEGSFVSERRGGVATGWSLIRPPGAAGVLPLVVALHALGADHTTLTGELFGLDRFLAAAVADGVPPFAIAAADGGRTYWHPRPSGEDAGAMVTDEFLPMLVEHDVDISRIGLLGWSMGGYGALRLAGLLGAERVAAVAAVSPAIWTDADEASDEGFESADEYEGFSVFGHQSDLAGIPVRVDCGTGDPFYREVEDYVAGFPPGADVTSSFEPGAHDPGYWRRMLPAELAFLGRHLGGELGGAA
jgi:predicted esterase